MRQKDEKLGIIMKKKSRLSLAILVASASFVTSPRSLFPQGKGSPAAKKPGLYIHNGENSANGVGENSVPEEIESKVEDDARGQMQQLTARLRQVGEGTSNPDATTQPQDQQ